MIYGAIRRRAIFLASAGAISLHADATFLVAAIRGDLRLSRPKRTISVLLRRRDDVADGRMISADARHSAVLAIEGKMRFRQPFHTLASMPAVSQVFAGAITARRSLPPRLFKPISADARCRRAHKFRMISAQEAFIEAAIRGGSAVATDKQQTRDAHGARLMILHTMRSR